VAAEIADLELIPADDGGVARMVRYSEIVAEWRAGADAYRLRLVGMEVPDEPRTFHRALLEDAALLVESLAVFQADLDTFVLTQGDVTTIEGSFERLEECDSRMRDILDAAQPVPPSVAFALDRIDDCGELS